MDIAIRVDGNIEIGAGHVIRCVTLAQKLGEYGIKCTFFVRNISKNLLYFIGQKFEIVLLDDCDPDFEPCDVYSYWLGVSERFDAFEFTQKIKSLGFCGVIVDHYGTGSIWDAVVKAMFDNLLVFDDLANREHNCKILVDQSIGRDCSSYAGLVPNDCLLLVGSNYALLRDEFLRGSEHFKKKYNVLINFGGVDKDNYTMHVLELLSQFLDTDEVHIKIIIGKDYPFKDVLTKKIEFKNLRVKLVESPQYIAQEIAECDFAIGAGGASLLERSAMGVPSILYAVAENQKHICEEYRKRNLGFLIQKGTKDELAVLRVAISELKKSSALSNLARLNKELVDGRGIDRVVKELLVSFNFFVFCKASIHSSRFIFECRYGCVDSSFYVNPEIPTYQEHENWLRSALKNKNCRHILLKVGKVKCGYFRLDEKRTYFDVSIYIDEKYRGKGFATVMLKYICDNFQSKKLMASVHMENTSSIRVFETCGFSIIEKSGDLLRLEYC